MSSGFISEAEIAERRRLRQEEWEKVRKPEDPEEAPEEQYDHRSLFERLEEQKQKREMEYEEAHKLKNMIKGLDDDEVEFLDLVDRTKLEQERLKCSEEAREIQNFRQAVACLQEKSLERRITTEIRQPTRVPSTNSLMSGPTSLGSRTSQTRLLAGAVVRKRTSDNAIGTDTPKKICLSPNQGQEIDKLNHTSEPNMLKESEKLEEKDKRKRKERDDTEINGVQSADLSNGEAMLCIGILPGMGSYHDSSDSEQSSDTDVDLPSSTGYDLLGRKLQSSSKKDGRNSSER